jgi:hypothetical protein
VHVLQPSHLAEHIGWGSALTSDGLAISSQLREDRPVSERSDELRRDVPHRLWADYALHGWRRPDGSLGPPHFKSAYSLREAIEDLVDNEQVADEGGYIVTDAVLDVSMTGRGPTIHVQLISRRELLEAAE